MNRYDHISRLSPTGIITASILVAIVAMAVSVALGPVSVDAKPSGGTQAAVHAAARA